MPLNLASIPPFRAPRIRRREAEDSSGREESNFLDFLRHTPFILTPRPRAFALVANMRRLRGMGCSFGETVGMVTGVSQGARGARQAKRWSRCCRVHMAQEK